MRSVKVILAWVLIGVILGGLIWFVLPLVRPRYTAEAIVKVLPTPEMRSAADAAALMKRQPFNEALLDMDAIQQTKWFQGFGQTRSERIDSGTAVLKRDLRVYRLRDSDYLVISMTCPDSEDAAAIVNLTVAAILKSQHVAKRESIARKLSSLEQHRARIDAELLAAERAKEDIRNRCGVADLDDHDYPHPVTARVIRLRAEQDNCSLELKEHQFRRDYLTGLPAESNHAAEIRDLDYKVKSVENKVSAINSMLSQAAEQEFALQNARAKYIQAQQVSDDMQHALDVVRSRIEEMRWLYDDPDAAGLLPLGQAQTPRQPDAAPWQIPAAFTAAGLAIGVARSLRPRRTAAT